MTEKRIVIVVLLLLPLIYFFPAVKGSLALVQGDGWTANLGLRILTGRMLSQGMMPLWNPYIFAGMPLLASIYPGVLYPPNWIFAFLPPGIAVNLVVITTYHLALVGAYRYARAIGSNRIGGVITGCMFTFGGYLVMSMGQTSTIATAAWLPWILLAFEKLYQRVSWAWVSIGAIFIALQFFAGVPQIFWYTILTSGAYFLFSATVREQRQPRWHFIFAGLAMGICGALLSAIQLLPLRELQQQSGRAGISYEEFSSYSFPLRQVLALVFPFFFGGASMPPYRIPYEGDWGIFVTAGYIGMMGMLLAAVAVIGLRKSSLMWFWAVIAVVSLVVSFGATLPFGMNHLLYQIPVYNLFRASSRHMLEFNLAVAVLAGMGVNLLSQPEAREKIRALRRGMIAITILVIFTTIAYRQHVVTASANSLQTGLLTNPEALVPICFFILSLAALWVYARRPGPICGTVLVLVLMCDLAAYGHFLEWKGYTFSVAEHLVDPPTVKAIKSRESDLNSFRILSYAVNPYNGNYELLDHPNLSIARDLQSASGYDMLRLLRPAALMGDMTAHGVVLDVTSFDDSHQGFNLLNVKYLLYERPGTVGSSGHITYDGIQFSEGVLDVKLRSGTHAEMLAGGVKATELAIISTLANSSGISDGVPVARINLHTTDGRIIERELQAGRDTSEWAWDRPDVRASIKHRRAAVAESSVANSPSGDFQSHRYLARIKFEPAQIERIEIVYVQKEADLNIARASLYDPAAGNSFPLSAASLPVSRWRKLDSFGSVDLYENLKVLPRAWFVRRVVALPRVDVLRAITERSLKDGSRFDPTTIALFEKEDGTVPDGLPITGESSNTQVSILKYEPQRIEITSRNEQPGFLVLSEIYYPGWEARIDRKRVPVERVNYALRGLAVPAGNHQIEFIFRSPSFRAGAGVSLLGLGILAVSSLFGHFLKRRR